jgi:hypothetical protein
MRHRIIDDDRHKEEVRNTMAVHGFSKKGGTSHLCHF